MRRAKWQASSRGRRSKRFGRKIVEVLDGGSISEA